jgi:RNA polymerase sigma factor (TIGR02999 family)
MRGESPAHTLQATALVHEVYVKLARSAQTFQNEQHLYAVVTTVMRQVLVDHARARATRKRGGDCVRVPLDNACRLAHEHDALFLDLQDAIERLRASDPLRVRMFELDFYAGLTRSEIADLVGTDASRVKYALSVTRAALRQFLQESNTSRPRN